jgi:two-component sensor histidine kinase
MDATNAAAVGYLDDGAAILEGATAAGVGVWRWAVDTNELLWSRNLESVHALPPGSFDGTLSSFQRDIHPEDAQPVWDQIRHSLETGEPYRAVYRTAPMPDREAIWIEACGKLVTDAEGRRFMTGVCSNVTERVRKEEELRRRLRQQKAVESVGTFALAHEDFQKVLDHAVETAAEVLSVPLAKILQFANSADRLLLRSGVGWADGLVGRATVGIDTESQAGYTLASSRPVIVKDLRTEVRFNGPALLHDHGVRSGVSVTIPGTDQRPFGVFGVHSPEPGRFDDADADFLLSLANIVASSARHVAAADHRQLLVREMAHRAGNLLQLVSTIASQTFRADADMGEARKSFTSRLSSLARANYLVSREGWSATRFRALLEEALDAFRDRIDFRGRDILLPPDLSFDLGLVLHELATNSAKYGSFGRTQGGIVIEWTLSRAADGTLLLSVAWIDPVSETPRRPAKEGGFGMRLIRALVEKKRGGTVSVSTEKGYRCSFTVVVEEEAASS